MFKTKITIKLYGKSNWEKFNKNWQRTSGDFAIKKWGKIRDYLQEVEERERFIKAFEESRGEKLIRLEEIKKKYKLK